MRLFTSSYKGGFLLIVSAFLVGYVGVTFFNKPISSSPALTNIFVGIVTVIGLAGAIVLGRTFYLRHNPFKKV